MSRRLPPPPSAPLMGRAALLAPTGPTRLENARSVEISLIRENPQQARQHFDEQALSELADSIRQHGILQPLILRPDGDAYIIVAGERRWRAATEAGLQTVPAIIREDLDSEEGAAILTALENLQREDLSVGDEARQYARLLVALNCSQHELARRLGIHYTRIARLVKILREAPALLEEIDAGRQTLTGVLASLTGSPSADPPTAGYNGPVFLFHGETKSPSGSVVADTARPAPPERTSRDDMPILEANNAARIVKNVRLFQNRMNRIDLREFSDASDRIELRRHLDELIWDLTTLRQMLEGGDAV